MNILSRVFVSLLGCDGLWAYALNIRRRHPAQKTNKGDKTLCNHNAKNYGVSSDD